VWKGWDLRLFVLTLSRLIVLIVSTARRFAWPTVIVLLALAVAGLVYTKDHLRMDSDTDHLFAASLPWRQAQIRENHDFPQFSNLLVAVVRAATPEEATETAAALNAGLQEDKANFIDSQYPAGSDFFAHEGLLLLPTSSRRSLFWGNWLPTPPRAACSPVSA
jgi:hypothetical protein